MLSLAFSIFTILTCGACAWFLMKVRENQELGLYDETSRKGLNAFIRALVMWIVAASIGVIDTALFNEALKDQVWYWIVAAILSILNSAFLLITIPFVQVNQPHQLEFVKAKSEARHVWLYSIIVLLITLLLGLLVGIEMIAKIPQPSRFISIFEMLFALFVVWHLIFRMIQAFAERNLESMIPIAWFTIGLIVFAEIFYLIPAFIPEKSPNLEWIQLSAELAIISYKTLLIFLILILVLSWQVKKHREELTEAAEKIDSQDKIISTLPNPEEVISPKEITQLIFHSPKGNEPSVSLKIGSSTIDISFNQQARQRFKNLLRLAIHRKFASETANQSIELDPQEAKRIRESLLREIGLQLIEADTSQNQTGLYQLGISSESIDFQDIEFSSRDKSLEELAEKLMSIWGLG